MAAITKDNDKRQEGSMSKPAKLSVTDLSHSDYTNLITSKTVNLIVGPKRKSYQVHKGLLCHLSVYFDKAFNGSFQEAEKAEIHLAKEDPAVIELLISWFYRGADALVATKDSVAILLGLYIAADKWCLPAVQDAVIRSTGTWFDLNSDKAITVLWYLVLVYYDCLPNSTADPYRGLILLYTIKAYRKNHRVKDSIEWECLTTHRGFARDLIQFQMAIVTLPAITELKLEAIRKTWHLH